MYTRNDIRAVEGILECTLPVSVVRHALNRASPLWQERSAFRFRFLDVEEHREYRRSFKDSVLFPLSYIPEARILWMDDESNFMAAFIEGPLSGRVALIGHDTNIDSAPLYRNVERFARFMAAGCQATDAEWPYRLDFPNGGDEIAAVQPSAAICSDLRCVAQLKEMLTSVASLVRRRFLCSCIVSLIPRKHAANLMELLHDSDYHVRGRACAMLGHYRLERACDQIGEIAFNPNDLARFRAVDGLGMMRSSKSLMILKRMVQSGLPLPGNVTAALSLHGCEARINQPGNAWFVRFPDERRWMPLMTSKDLRPVKWWYEKPTCLFFP